MLESVEEETPSASVDVDTRVVQFSAMVSEAAGTVVRRSAQFA